MDRSADAGLDRPVDYASLEEGRHVNYWAYDPVLRGEVARTYPDDAEAWGRERLSSFGQAVGHTIADNSDVVDRHGPELHTYDADGEVINEVEYHPAQFESERLVVEHGALADGFHAPPGRDDPMPHTHTLAMLYLLTYADVGLTCPMAMTAGVALVLEKFDDDGGLQEFFDGVTARGYDESMQGAMFLTEKQGGSDVGATETTAERADDGTWRLTGEKWFCSNVDAEAALALARRPDAPDGTDGLSLFLLPRTKRDGSTNDVRYRRLKDKLGTVSVPTGEMELDGAEAYLVGDPEEGFRQMSEMLNYERLANAMGAMGLVGRALLEAKVHAASREAFGSTIDQYPLMRADLVDMAVDHEAGTAFTFEAARVFNQREREARSASNGSTGHSPGERTGEGDAYRLMRLLVPIAKYRTGRLAVDTASYAMEVLGGNGYVRDFVTERLLRDAQVLPIWEGTSNILSLDVLRALDRGDAHEPLLSAIQARLDAVEHPILADDADAVRDAFADLGDALATLAAEDRDYAQLYAKRLADLIFDVFTAALLLEEAQNRLDADGGGDAGGDGSGDARKALVARRFVDRHLREQDARGITSGDRLPDEQFDAIVRFAPVAPEDVAETAAED